MNEEEYRIRVALDRLITAISSGAALSDLMRMTAQISVYVGWPFGENGENKEGSEEE